MINTFTKRNLENCSSNYLKCILKYRFKCTMQSYWFNQISFQKLSLNLQTSFSRLLFRFTFQIQYQFLHDALLEALSYRKLCVPADSFPSSYQVKCREGDGAPSDIQLEYAVSIPYKFQLPFT